MRSFSSSSHEVPTPASYGPAMSSYHSVHPTPSGTSGLAPRTRRIALYSHDTQGIGHVRRNSLIAAAIVAGHPDVAVLLLSGAPESTALPMPPRTDLVTVPSLAKDRAGDYGARAMPAPLADVLAIRESILDAALQSFAPDLLVVDKVPRGILGELDRPLRRVRERYGTRTVLGLRDVLDDAATTAREWEAARTSEAIRTLYDQIWVYGDPTVFDPAVEYHWSTATRRKVAYTGYLAHGRSRLLGETSPDGPAPGAVRAVAGPIVLCLVGGGQDGAALARAFADADIPAGHTGVLVTGPYIDPEAADHLRATASGRDDLVVHRFVGDVPALADRSAATVSMGGYNSVCELLAAGRPTLLVPRTVPRQEQSVRAERLAERGLVDVASNATATPAAVGEWLAEAAGRPHRRAGNGVDLDGLSRLPGLAHQLLIDHHREAEEGTHAAV